MHALIDRTSQAACVVQRLLDRGEFVESADRAGDMEHSGGSRRGRRGGRALSPAQRIQLAELLAILTASTRDPG